MSPPGTPASKSEKYVPLPEPLPKEDKKEKKSTKEKPKVHIKEHKRYGSYDTGYASGYSSPYSFEDRSPDQYAPSPKSAKTRPEVTQYEELVDNRPTTVKYVTKDGRRVKYVNRKPGSPKEEDYFSTPRSDPDKYKSKYKAVKETSKVLQGAPAETTDTAQHNYQAAKREEAIKLQTMEELEGQLRALMLQSQVLEDRVADEERKRMQAERKLQQKELETELTNRKEALARREKELERKQWDEITSSPSPVARKPTRALPPLIKQDDYKPSRRNTTSLAMTGYPTTGYPTSALTSASRSPGLTAAVSPFVGMDAILEAQRDYDATKDRGPEDRRKATDIKYSYGARSTRERSRRDSFHP